MGPFFSGDALQTSFDGVLARDEGDAWKSGQQAFNGAEMALTGVNATGDTVTWDANTRCRGQVWSGGGCHGHLVSQLHGRSQACWPSSLRRHRDLQFVSLAFERTTDASILPRLAQFQELAPHMGRVVGRTGEQTHRCRIDWCGRHRSFVSDHGVLGPRIGSSDSHRIQRSRHRGGLCC